MLPSRGKPDVETAASAVLRLMATAPKPANDPAGPAANDPKKE